MVTRPRSTYRELGDITECPICQEQLSDPRVLPCIHTFCLQCLLIYGNDRPPGSVMPCPVCRKTFNIPNGGLVETQKNFLMEKLLHVRKLSAETIALYLPSVCDACSSDEASAHANETAERATMYCVQCQLNYCTQCSSNHATMEDTADHRQVEIGKPLSREEADIAMKLPPKACEVHKNEETKVFCLECRVAICVMCFIKSHKHHDCSDIEDVSADLRVQITSDHGKVAEDLKKTGTLLPGFEKDKIDLVHQLFDMKSQINEAADRLIEDVECDRIKLLSEADSVTLKRAKELETVKEEVEQHMVALESFQLYSDTLLTSGTACDVARSTKGLHDRANELTTFDVVGYVKSCQPRVTRRFATSSIVNRGSGNLVGNIIEVEKPAEPSVTHVLPQGNGITGVTSLGDDVFLVRYKTAHVEVYNAVSLVLRRRLAVPGLGPYPYGLAACAVNECLYVADSDYDSVHRVDLSVGDTVTRWSVASWPAGLSVNGAQNVLVVSQAECQLQEFTTHGSLLRNIQLQLGIAYPHHAIQLTADRFLVSHYGPSLHRVCLVDAKGAMVGSYGGPSESGPTTLCQPEGLAIDGQGHVLVADTLNNRLLVLDLSLSSAREMSLSVDGGLDDPFSLCYEEVHRRLYVGESGTGRLIVIDHLKNFDASSILASD